MVPEAVRLKLAVAGFGLALGVEGFGFGCSDGLAEGISLGGGWLGDGVAEVAAWEDAGGDGAACGCADEHALTHRRPASTRAIRIVQTLLTVFPGRYRP